MPISKRITNLDMGVVGILTTKVKLLIKTLEAHKSQTMKRYITFIILICCVFSSTRAQSPLESTPPGMVLVPGGTFLMGSNANEHSSSFPAHMVSLSPFYMDEREVSNGEYYKFCMEKGHKFPEFWGMDIYKSGPDFPDHPVIGVSHFDATLYASWAGKRLPTEAEWEYAARGGLEFIAYPYGEKADHNEARFNDPEAPKGPVKTGSYAVNGFGLFDMSGNVWEWVSDWFDVKYYSESPEKNPGGPPGGTFRVIRGGGWHSGGGCVSVSYRNGLPQNWVDFAGGFRCVKDQE